MNSPIRIPTKECIEIFENIEKNNYNDYPSYPAIECNNISLIGRDGNIWTSIDNKWVLLSTTLSSPIDDPKLDQ